MMAATTSQPDILALGDRLTELEKDIRANDSPEQWQEAEKAAQVVANGLRTRTSADYHTALGKTALPRSLASLLNLALRGAATPELDRITPIVELLRVTANICMDHDENRNHIYEAGLLQAVLTLLEGYAESLPKPPYTKAYAIPIPHLKVIRTAVGALLNASLGYEPVQTRLRSLQAHMTLVKLAIAIYPPGSWLDDASESGKALEESWELRSSLSNWAWRTVSELKEQGEDTIQIFDSDALPFITPTLTRFLAPYANLPPNLAFPQGSDMFDKLVEADFEILDDCCEVLESLCLDVEDVRLSLARGYYDPDGEHLGVPCLSHMLDFVEHGGYPPVWRTVFDDGDRRTKEKAFDVCKSAIVKAIVEMSGEERNEPILFASIGSGGPYVERMVGWIKAFVKSADEASSSDSLPRDDLVICATLSLGNLARRELEAVTLLSPPHSLAPVLASRHIISPTTDLKLKHGVLGLLKHLAQSSPSPVVHTPLAEARLVQCIVDSGLFEEKGDQMTEVVQLNAIGVVKHMCNANVDNSFTLVLPDPAASSSRPTGLSQILGLVKRTENIAIRSEGTRVLVNVIKSLFSNAPPTSPTTVLPSPVTQAASNHEAAIEKQQKKEETIKALLNKDCTSALANLITRGAKFPLLINEGVVALSLLAMHKEGAPLVLESLLTQITVDAPPLPSIVEPSLSNSPSTSSDLSSAIVTPQSTTGPRGRSSQRSALQTLAAALRNLDNPTNYPVEVRVNVCSLLLQISRKGAGEELGKVKEVMRPVLESVAESVRSAAGKDELLLKATRKVLELWATA
ncbi:uncharacterized protein SCHCODRAFT_02607671 [Schizophyllum commune H4-8]|nr:uncharacterized protein SCHCODRAFT_02607671 [Schizophyllum commune H4-8]KAI5900352.1 hypothetical protein SCHCODRAFT_02607671 [Schizophyllum commune H4-8]